MHRSLRRISSKNLLLQLLHSMLLIIENGQREWECPGHSHVGERDNDHAIGFLRLNVTGDAARISKV
jgi:hypothetical protein